MTEVKTETTKGDVSAGSDKSTGGNETVGSDASTGSDTRTRRNSIIPDVKIARAVHDKMCEQAFDDMIGQICDLLNADGYVWTIGQNNTMLTTQLCRKFSALFEQKGYSVKFYTRVAGIHFETSIAILPPEMDLVVDPRVYREVKL